MFCFFSLTLAQPRPRRSVVVQAICKSLEPPLPREVPKEYEQGWHVSLGLAACELSSQSLMALCNGAWLAFEQAKGAAREDVHRTPSSAQHHLRRETTKGARAQGQHLKQLWLHTWPTHLLGACSAKLSPPAHDDRSDPSSKRTAPCCEASFFSRVTVQIPVFLSTIPAYGRPCRPMDPRLTNPWMDSPPSTRTVAAHVVMDVQVMSANSSNLDNASNDHFCFLQVHNVVSTTVPLTTTPRSELAVVCQNRPHVCRGMRRISFDWRLTRHRRGAQEYRTHKWRWPPSLSGTLELADACHCGMVDDDSHEPPDGRCFSPFKSLHIDESTSGPTPTTSPDDRRETHEPRDGEEGRRGVGSYLLPFCYLHSRVVLENLTEGYTDSFKATRPNTRSCRTASPEVKPPFEARYFPHASGSTKQRHEMTTLLARRPGEQRMPENGGHLQVRVVYL